MEILQKVFTWKLQEVVKPTDYETKTLDKLKLYENDEIKRCYVSWRRAHFIFILPFASSTAICNVTALFLDDSILYSKVGSWLNILPGLNTIFILLSIVYSLSRWFDVEKSYHIVQWAWIGVILFTFIPAFVPSEHVLSTIFTQNVDKLNTGRLILVSKYAITVLPIIAAWPLSALSACLIVRGLFPT